MNNQLTKIILQGFDTRVIKAFEVFFANKCNGMFSIEAGTNPAPIAIIDFDTFHNKLKVKELKNENPEIIIFGLSLIEQEINIENILFLKKPINYLDLKKELIAAKKSIQSGRPLKRKTKNMSGSGVSYVVSMTKRYEKHKDSIDVSAAKSKATKAKIISAKTTRTSYSTSAANILNKLEESHFVGSHQDVRFSNPRDLLKVMYSTERGMQRVVTTAIKYARSSGSSVQALYFGFEFIVDPLNNIVYTVAGDSVLRPLCLLDTKEVETMNLLGKRVSESNIFLKSIKSGKKLINTNCDKFLWKVALWSSRGRLPDSIDINAPAYLKEWPNLTRLNSFPQAMRIAAFLIKQPCKLDEIAVRLDIPQRYVFSFFSAAYAIGIAGISVRKIDSTFTSDIAPKKLAPRAFLKKILGKLIGSSKKIKEEVVS